jgi:proline-specific peptidase
MRSRVNNTELFYTIVGAGVPVLLMPGVGLDHSYLRPWLDHLSSRYQLIYYDHRGCGSSLSSDDINQLTPDTWVEDAHALMRDLGYDTFILYGHSVGGYIAQEYAIKHGSSLSGLILDSTAPILDQPSLILANAQSRGTPKQVQTVLEFFSAPPTDNEEMRRAIEIILPLYFYSYDPVIAQSLLEEIKLSALVYNRVYSFYTTVDTTERLRKVSVPTLVLAGNDDWITPPAAGSERLAAALPNAETVVFQKCGHFPFIEQSQKHKEALSDWIRKKLS